MSIDFYNKYRQFIDFSYTHPRIFSLNHRHSSTNVVIYLSTHYIFTVFVCLTTYIEYIDISFHATTH